MNTAKGTIRFPLDKPLPLDLISKIVKFRLAENLKKAAEKTARESKRDKKGFTHGGCPCLAA